MLIKVNNQKIKQENLSTMILKRFIKNTVLGYKNDRKSFVKSK